MEYIEEVKFRVFLDTKQPDRVHIASKDERFVNAKGDSPGIRFVASSNPLSADYNPNVYNRVIRAWKAEGWSLPQGMDEVQEKRRHMTDRIALIVDHLRRKATDDE